MDSTARKHGKRARGFTIVEVLVAVTVISILLLMTWNTVAGARDRARQASTMADMHMLALAIEAYSIDYNYPPPSNDFLTIGEQLKPYTARTEVPVHDHWRHVYEYSAQKLNYTITSTGKDGLPGKPLTWETRMEFERDIVLVDGHFRDFPEDFYGNGSWNGEGSGNNGHHYGQDHGTGRPAGP